MIPPPGCPPTALTLTWKKASIQEPVLMHRLLIRHPLASVTICHLAMLIMGSG